MDVTDHLSAEGRFTWEPPDGTWEVIRFGYTTTGAMNLPPTEAGRGLECDKMDTAALNLHFNSFPAKLIETAGSLTENTFRYLFIDSWECGYQNWTKNFPEEFEKRRGYSILRWIPALSGEIIENNRTTEAFLHDFRLTIGELIEANYYKHFAVLCKERAMDFHAEVIYGGENYPPLKILKSNEYVDLPMYEFWTNQDQHGIIEYSPVANTGYVISAHAGHLYGKNVIPAEAYTGYAYYSESPWDLKPFGDRAFCRGINRIVLHSYVHQPGEKKPGMTLALFANHFNRHNAWWPHIRGWTEFQARVQYLLQQGTTVSDILYLEGDRMPQYQPATGIYDVPTGFKSQLFNADVLFHDAGAEGTGIISIADQTFKLLVLPHDSVMDLETLQGIARLVENGATLFGPPPSSTLSLKQLEEETAELKDLAKKIWGKSGRKSMTDHNCGKGRVIWGESLGQVLKKLGIRPDFEWISGDSAKLLFIHKKIGTNDVYYVANQESRSVGTECIFRVAGKTPEIWDPQDGSIRRTALFAIEDDRTRLPVSFGPRESLLFVFSDKKPEEFIAALSSADSRLFPSNGKENIPDMIPEITFSESGYTIQSESGGSYQLTTNKGRSGHAVTEPMAVLTIEDHEIELYFNTNNPPQAITSLKSWTEFENPDLKHFSGRADYTIKFNLPDDWTGRDDPVYLSLGEVHVTARVSLNGESLGTLWMPDFRIPVSGYLKEGENLLEVQVANVYRNRIIGDLKQFGQMKNIWTTAPIDNFFNAEMPLRSSGLLGPVRLLAPAPVGISFGE
jgi:hypothetical protein